MKRKMKGLTIIQTMVILLVVGLAGFYLVRYLADKRCESDPKREACAKDLPPARK